MQYSIKTKPLLPDMVACKKCKNSGKRAYTEMATFCPYDKADQYAIYHWCDTGEPDEEWIDVKRYCHGYVGADFVGELQESKQDAINEWNKINSKSWFSKIFS